LRAEPGGSQRGLPRRSNWPSRPRRRQPRRQRRIPDPPRDQHCPCSSRSAPDQPDTWQVAAGAALRTATDNPARRAVAQLVLAALRSNELGEHTRKASPPTNL